MAASTSATTAVRRRPAGTLSFRFLYWGKFGPETRSIWGSCWHPVTGGTGDFAGAEGVLTMVDTPNAKGVTDQLHRQHHDRRGRRAHAGARGDPVHCG